MRAIQVIDSKPELVHLDEPSGHGVRVRVEASSICGSDLHMMERGIVEGRVLGHEFAGTTPDGTAVAVEPIRSCGECSPCADGYPVHCQVEGAILGVFTDGGMAEVVNVPAERLVPLPTGLDVSRATLVEPLAVALHGLNRARVREGDRVLVVGAGPIGLAAGAALHGRGIAYDIVARHEHQKQSAEALGGNIDCGDGYDVVLDAVGSTQSLLDATNRAKPMGRIGLLGSFWQPAQLGFEFCAKEVELIVSSMYRCSSPGRDFEEAGALLAANPAIADALVTHRFPLEACSEAFATAADRAAGAIKVVFDL